MHIRTCSYWSKPILLETCVRLLAIQDLCTLHVPRCSFGKEPAESVLEQCSNSLRTYFQEVRSSHCFPFDCATVDMEYHALVSRQEGGPPMMPPRSPEYMAENQAGRLLAVEGSLFALSTTTVLLRFYVRIFMLKTFGWDGTYNPLIYSRIKHD